MNKGASFQPTSTVLVRHGVKFDSARVLLSRESIAEGVTLALTLRDVLPKALMRWLVKRFVLREVEQLRLVFVPSSFLPSVSPAAPFWFVMPARATCEDLARHIHEKRWDFSLPVDTFWVHVRNGANKPELCMMGFRANKCIANRWSYFEEWTENGGEALTEQELQWLNSRTLLEAGFSNGSNIDARYHYELAKVATGTLLSPHFSPQGEREEEVEGKLRA